MRDILPGLVSWHRAGTPFALATVVGTWDSAPRPVGTGMAVSDAGDVLGNVSAGCVESAVYAEALDVLATGVPRLLRYGVSDSDAFAVGLTCGGTVEVFVQAVDRTHLRDAADLFDAVGRGAPVAWAYPIDPVAAPGAGPAPSPGGGPDRDGPGAPNRPGPDEHVLVRPDGVTGTLGSPGLDSAVTRAAQALLATGRSGRVQVGPDGGPHADDRTVFVHSFAPPPHLIICGAIDVAAALSRLGRFLGYRVTVCDARPTFATAARFPDADELVVGWPHRHLERIELDERSVLCVLTHDPKVDLPLLQAALATPARYIGVMGSRRTQATREAALRARGVTEAQLARLASPIGLDLGGRTAEETALSIAAEIVASARGGTGRPLAGLSAPIHHQE